MTDQRPYTPTTEQIELLVLDQLKQSAEKRELPVDVEADRADFRHWLAERDARIEAAAEQRGNLDGWDEALELLENNSEIDQDAVDHYKSLNPNRINRADQMEGDE